MLRLQSLHIVQQHCLWEITVWENLKLACGSSAIRQESLHGAIEKCKRSRIFHYVMTHIITHHVLCCVHTNW